jgi:ATP-binding cassette subfamily C protein CydC
MQWRDYTQLKPWLKLMAGQRWRLLGGALLMALTVFSAIGLLSVSGWFITGTAVTGLVFAAGLRVAFDIYTPGAAIRTFAVSRTITRYLERLFNHDTVLRILADLRTAVFGQLTRLDASEFRKLRASEWLNRLTSDIDTLDNLYLRLLAPPLVAAAGIGLLGILSAVFLPQLTVPLMLGLGLVLLAITWGIARISRRASHALTAQLEQLRIKTVEQLQGLSELTSYHTLVHSQDQIMAEEARLQAQQTSIQRQVAWANALSTLGVQVAAVLTLSTALFAFSQGHISGPVAVMLPLAVLALGEAFANLPKAFGHWGATLAAAERLQQPAQAQPAEPTASAISGWQRLSLESVTYQYPGALNAALEPLSLDLCAGEKLGIIGVSGQGKSTLAQLLAGLLAPSSGRILIDGSAVRLWQNPHWLAQLGYLTQYTDLFNESVANNLRIAQPNASDDSLWEALQAVGLAEFVRALPEQLDTPMGEAGKQFSGGEARRIALARLMLKNPAVVLVDEPFSGLDQATAQAIQTVLEPWLEGRTLLAFGHAPEALPTVDRVISLDVGPLP